MPSALWFLLGLLLGALAMAVALSADPPRPFGVKEYLGWKEE